MKKLLTLTLVVFFPVVSHGFDVKNYCKQVSDISGGSYQIEESCLQMEIESRNNINAMKVPSRIKKYCQEIGQIAGGSYAIMEQCIIEELAAKKRISQ